MASQPSFMKVPQRDGEKLYELYRDVFVGNANWWALTPDLKLKWERLAELVRQNRG